MIRIPYLPIYLPSIYSYATFYPLSLPLNAPNRSSKSQIPRPRRTTIQPRPIEILLGEEIPALLRIYARQIPIQNTPPAACDA